MYLWEILSYFKGYYFPKYKLCIFRVKWILEWIHEKVIKYVNYVLLKICNDRNIIFIWLYLSYWDLFQSFFKSTVYCQSGFLPFVLYFWWDTIKKRNRLIVKINNLEFDYEFFFSHLLPLHHYNFSFNINQKI